MTPDAPVPVVPDTAPRPVLGPRDMRFEQRRKVPVWFAFGSGPVRHLRGRRAAIVHPYGEFVCGCPWWLRLWYLVTGR